MEEFLKYILEKVVNVPDSINIEKEEDDNQIRYNLSIAEEDFGRVVGKKGRTINAIRNLASLYYFKNNSDSSKRIFINLKEN